MSAPTADIREGSTWVGRAEGFAIVLSVAAGYVRIRTEAGDVREVYHQHFRAQYLQPYNARQLRVQFYMSLSNIGCFNAFWSPGQRKVFARSAEIPFADLRTATRGRPALPADAMFVGCYVDSDLRRRRKRGADHFFEDLNDVLATFIQHSDASLAI